ISIRRRVGARQLGADGFRDQRHQENTRIENSRYREHSLGAIERFLCNGCDPMSPEALRKKIEDEIGGNWDRSNRHQIDLKQCLLPRPIQRIYENSQYRTDQSEEPENTRLLLLWLVLKEHGDDIKYSIVYNERTQTF